MGGLTGPVLVATRSAHKLEEIRSILADAPVRFLSIEDLGLPELAEEAELEPFETFARNALSKARYFHHRSGVPTLADDSGLCVDALDGGPGVRTRRFAPDDWVERWGRAEANNRWLLDRLAGVPPGGRGAHYRCAIAIVDDLEHATFEGTVHGSIAMERRGSGGFGYDPLFLLGGGDASYAELPPATKRATSHRALALRDCLPWLEALADGSSGP
ncbi:MAG: non-canonical purine NTP pyrophosphatase [Gemmatimonadota bacterium]